MRIAPAILMLPLALGWLAGPLAVAGAPPATAQCEMPSLAGGLTLGSIAPDSPHYERTDGAVVVDVQPGSEAARAGLRSGDIIVGVGQEAVTSPAEVGRKAAVRKGKVLLKMLRNGSALPLTLG